MKKLSLLIMFVGLLAFVSGCSGGSSSSDYQPGDVKQAQAGGKDKAQGKGGGAPMKASND